MKLITLSIPQFVTATESFWRICGFDVHGRDPSIQQLAVHEENLQMVTFNEENPREAVFQSKEYHSSWLV